MCSDNYIDLYGLLTNTVFDESHRRHAVGLSSRLSARYGRSPIFIYEDSKGLLAAIPHDLIR